MTERERPSTIPAMLAEVVAARGDHDALVTAQGTLSYSELDRETAHTARALLKLGAGKGTRIALMAPDGVLWITTFLAALRIGALVTAVSTLCTPRELAHILRNSDTQIFVGARRFLRHDYAEKLVKALPELAGGTAGSLCVPGAPYLRSVWLDDAGDLPWAGAVDDLLALADEPGAPADNILNCIEAEVVPSDDAVIVYTSGSTSMPKAVVHSQWNIARHPPELAKLFILEPDDRMMPLLPAFWLGGMAMLLEVFSSGATLVYPPSPDMEDVLDAIEQCKVNRINSWGDMLVKLREAAVARGIDVDAIIGLGPFRDASGELIPPHLQSNMLGMSETFAPHSAEPLDVRLPADKAGASGRSVNNYERRVVDPETGLEVAPGEVGELQLRGGALMTGFYKRDRREVFTEDGFYPTGDLVRIDRDGYLFFVARRNDMIKTKAANVSRLEVEAALRELPDVALAVVTGLDDAELGQRVVAAVVPKAGTAPTQESLRAALKESLSSYKIPRNIVLIGEEDIPRTSTGKIKLFELAEMISRRL
ncbi:MAG: acyl--CoA ligase [Bacteroidales bacterium]|nr:acyl--CoA ligase [Bacteroidales bacterium]